METVITPLLLAGPQALGKLRVTRHLSLLLALLLISAQNSWAAGTCHCSVRMWNGPEIDKWDAQGKLPFSWGKCRKEEQELCVQKCKNEMGTCIFRNNATEISASGRCATYLDILNRQCAQVPSLRQKIFTHVKVHAGGDCTVKKNWIWFPKGTNEIVMMVNCREPLPAPAAGNPSSGGTTKNPPAGCETAAVHEASCSAGFTYCVDWVPTYKNLYDMCVSGDGKITKQPLCPNGAPPNISFSQVRSEVDVCK